MRNALPCLLAGLFFLSGQSSIAQNAVPNQHLSPGIGQIVAAVDTFMNDSDQQVKRISVPVTFGLSWGQFALDENVFPPGSYSIRAYTRWMENFGEDVFFHRRFFIAPSNLPELMARQRPSGRKAHSSGTPTSSANPTHSGHIDLQFIPEGGWLVAGLPSRVGFKATGEDGLGRDIKGTILDSKDDTIVPLRSLYKGMGVFELSPQPGERYTASIELPDGSTQRFPLPGK